ncbi:hypothetical protein PLESTM_002012800 [Pleodorina starrii]|nr:hypothetical protein PLESTM_002012800 [Pleodorina starrii]
MARLEETSAKDSAALLAADTASWLQSQVLSAAVPVQLLSALVGAHLPYSGAAREAFLDVAPVLLQQAPYRSSQVLQLLPGGVIEDVVPLAGNERLIGLDVFASTLTGNRDGALKAVRDHSMTLVGPMTPVQGGNSLIMRMPLFLSGLSSSSAAAELAANASGTTAYSDGIGAGVPPPRSPGCGEPCAYDPVTGTMFWGFVSSVVALDALLQPQHGANGSRLESLKAMGYRYRVEALGLADDSLRVVAASSRVPTKPVEARVVLPNAEWVVELSPDSDRGWQPAYFGGLLLAVVVLALAFAVLLFTVLVSRRKYLLLLESLVPKALIPELQAAAPVTEPSVRQHQARKQQFGSSPADLLLSMVGEMMQGQLPALQGLVLVRSALLGHRDLYTPLNVMGRIHDTIADADVARSLMRQLGGQQEAGALRSLGEDGKGDDGGFYCRDIVGTMTRTASSSALQQYDMGTVGGAVAFILSNNASCSGEWQQHQHQQQHPQRHSSNTAGALVAKKSSNKSLDIMYNNTLSQDRSKHANASHGRNTTDNANPAPPSGSVAPVAVEARRLKPPPRPSSPLQQQPTDLVANPAVSVAIGTPSGDAPADGGEPLLAPPHATSGGSSLCAGHIQHSSQDEDEFDAPVLPLRISRLPGEHKSGSSTLVPAVLTSTMTLSPALPASPSPSVSLAVTEPLVAARPKTVPSPSLSGLAPHQDTWRTPRRVASLVCLTGQQLTGAAGPRLSREPLAAVAAAGAPASPATFVAVNASALEAFHPSGVGRRTPPSPLLPVPPPLALMTPLLQETPQQHSRQAAEPPSPPHGSSPTPQQQRFRRLPNRHASFADFADRATQADGTLSSLRPATIAAQAAARESCLLGGRAASGWPVAAAAGTPDDITKKRSASVTGAISRLLSISGLDTDGSKLIAHRFPPDAAGGGGGGGGGSRMPSFSAMIRPVRSRLRFSAVSQVERLLSEAHSGWQYDIWALQGATQGHALSVLGFYLIQRAGLISRFGLSAVRLARLLRRIEAGYLDNPYHNAVHAADVLQTLHVIVHGARLHVHYLDPLGLLAAYLAAIIHDYAHPGLTGDFLVATSHPLALRYNDRSPLENHHCAAAFELLTRHTELDVLEPLSTADKAALRKLVIELVLATDMKQHFSTLTHFNTVHQLASTKSFAAAGSSGEGLLKSAPGGRLANVQQEFKEALYADGGPDGAAFASGGPDAAAAALAPLDDSERLLSLQVALKVADLGHLAEQMEVHKRWLAALEAEFFLQGDLERQMGLPISPLFDREKQGVSKSQVGFFEFVALPLANALSSAFPGAQPLMECLTSNYRHWRRAEREAAAAAAQQQASAAAATAATITAATAAAAATAPAAATSGGQGYPPSQLPPRPSPADASSADLEP